MHDDPLNDHVTTGVTGAYVPAYNNLATNNAATRQDPNRWHDRRDSQGAAGDFLGINRPPGRSRHVSSQFAKAAGNNVPIQWLVGGKTEYSWEKRRLNAPEQYIGIGHGERAVAAVTRGTGAGARGIRAHPQSRAIEVDNGTAPGRDAVDAHHRRANPDAADLGIDPASVDTAEPAPTTLAYTSYLLAAVRGGSYADGIGTVLPCYWIYWEVGRELLRRGSPDPRYQRWIDMDGGEVPTL